MKQTISFTLNHRPCTVEADPAARFLDVLRNDLNLRGTKEGCGVGECGACTIVVNGVAVTCCLLLAGQVNDAEIMTVEGLSETEIGSVLQRCFIENGAVQCGFCTPGMLMSAYALLKHNPNPSREEIKEAIAGNLCRCTGYTPIVNSIEAAVRSMKNG